MRTFSPSLKMTVSANWAFSRNTDFASGSDAASPIAWSDVGNKMRVKSYVFERVSLAYLVYTNERTSCLLPRAWAPERQDARQQNR